jgi:hypothetical protein
MHTATLKIRNPFICLMTSISSGWASNDDEGRAEEKYEGESRIAAVQVKLLTMTPTCPREADMTHAAKDGPVCEPWRWV